jgi:hypothetical protein
MSRPSQERKKSARKPTPRCAALETIREDEDLVATATLSTLQGPDVIGSKALHKTSKRGRRRKEKVSRYVDVSVDPITDPFPVDSTMFAN